VKTSNITQLVFSFAIDFVIKTLNVEAAILHLRVTIEERTLKDVMSGE
jgi:hypothetical protein